MIYRAALIGCGRIGSEYDEAPRVKGIYSHAGAYAACPQTRLVAVCDKDPDKVARCGERWSVAARYCDPQQMLAEQHPDIVSICTPASTHSSIIHTALATPGVRAILAEKPLTLELEEASEIVRVAAENGVVLAVNYLRRYAEGHNRLRQFLQSGGIGEIRTIAGYYTKGTFNNGTHWFDLARFLVGEVIRVRGVDVLKEDGDDPTLDAFLEFDSGVNAHLQGCEEAAFSLFEMDLIGASGRARVIESGRTIEVYELVEDPYFTGYKTVARKEKLEGGLHYGLLHAVENLVRCVNDGSQPACSGADALAIHSSSPYAATRAAQARWRR
ncbi:MAG: Gfo/Idh/MocA family oxidoreductase [Candidatus Tectomicrobia bacterium]|uniref:Gfo/Idh/MocA family oxidoreductase n=1 Tax=Tectimicrobiota bacterium TaxID=2528274 RepID=A0A932M180_UNCTE|nr:Gfo/Idh/MocA family oxidoreductase [Candidatus Tectomicrobia bacterium]